jgi:hypothetical protein
MKMAERLTNEYKDVQFNPDFFDNVKPKKTLLEMIRQGIRKLLIGN